MRVYVVVDDCTKVVDCHEIYTYVCATEEIALKKVRELCKQALKYSYIEDEDSQDDYMDDSSDSFIYSDDGRKFEFQFNQRSFILSNDNDYDEHCYIDEQEVIS